MARRIITVDNDNQQAKPEGTQWRRIGLRQHPDYQVRWDRGNLNTGHTTCESLTQARREARALVREGRAWAEVFRYYESGLRIGKAFICSYEVEIESGSAV